MHEFIPKITFLLGAQKAGTTSLANLLSSHQDICLATGKETQFFSQNYHLGFDWYLGQFSNKSAKILLDASTSYTSAALPNFSENLSNSAVFRILDYQEIHKFIYIYRDPVERLYSAYWHEVRAGREKYPFRSAISRFPYYVYPSFCYYQISRYLDNFPINKFLFIDFNLLSENQLDTANQCARFLGLAEPLPPEIELEYSNKSFTHTLTGELVNTMLPDVAARKRFFATLKKNIPRRLYNSAKSMMIKNTPNISSDDREYAASIFQDDHRAWIKFLEQEGVNALRL